LYAHIAAQVVKMVAELPLPFGATCQPYTVGIERFQPLVLLVLAMAFLIEKSRTATQFVAGYRSAAMHQTAVV
jgi:hypothetical protein